MKVKNINHVAIVVPDLDHSITFWRDIFGLKLEQVEDVPSQKSKVASLKVGAEKIELVQPTVEECGLGRFLLEHGAGMHHICFEVDHIEEALAELKSKGVRLINETPQVLEGRKMAFIHPKATNGVLIELYELI
jgi:methylmalonyl-CoA/ethylmalonyl-CoA epimerase